MSHLSPAELRGESDNDCNNSIMQLCGHSPSSHFELSLRDALSRYRTVKRLTVTSHCALDQFQTIKHIKVAMESKSRCSPCIEMLALVGMKTMPEDLAQVLRTVVSDTHSLQTLEINECNLPPTELRVIAGSFARNLHLECVRINRCQLSSYTAVIVFNALAAAPSLRSLVLHCIDVQCEDLDRGIAQVFKSTNSLTHLEIELPLDTTHRYTDLLEGLRQNRTIERLTVRLVSIKKEAGQALIGALSHSSTLQSLHVEFGSKVPWAEIYGLTGAIASMLEMNNTLQSLSLSQEQATCTYSHYVSHTQGKFGTIRALFNALEKNQGLLHFHSMHTLKQCIGGMAASVFATLVAGLIQRNSMLRTLDLSGFRIDGEHDPDILHTIFLAVDKNTSLERLALNIEPDMFGTRDGPFAFAVWRQGDANGNAEDSDSPRIGSSVVEWIKTFQNNHTMHTLDLNPSFSLRTHLAGVPLHSLKILCPMLKSAQMKELCTYLSGGTFLHALNISSDTCATRLNTGADAQLYDSISNVLARNTTLRHLSLCSKSMRDEDAVILARGLGENHTLQSLSLSDVSILTEGMRALCTSLKHKSALCALHVGHVSKTDTSEALSELLDCNTRLQHLGMEIGSGIMMEGSIYRTLIRSYTLQSVRLAAHKDNNDAFLKEIAAALRHNTLIRNLHIEHVHPSPAWVDVFHTLMHHPRSRTLELKLDSSRYSCIRSSLRDGTMHNVMHWTDNDILEFLRDVHVDKIIAFSTGFHSRLGENSLVRNLSHDSIRVIMLSYFGLPHLGYKDPPHRAATYMRVLEEMALLQ
jgi:hypothetical protein